MGLTNGEKGLFAADEVVLNQLVKCGPKSEAEWYGASSGCRYGIVDCLSPIRHDEKVPGGETLAPALEASSSWPIGMVASLALCRGALGPVICNWPVLPIASRAALLLLRRWSLPLPQPPPVTAIVESLSARPASPTSKAVHRREDGTSQLERSQHNNQQLLCDAHTSPNRKEARPASAYKRALIFDQDITPALQRAGGALACAFFTLPKLPWHSQFATLAC